MKQLSLGFLVYPWAAIMLFSSCSSYYFTHPQPVDAPSLTDFPVSMQGNWITDDNDKVLVEPSAIGIIQQDTIRIMRGAWPIVKGDQFEYPPERILPFSTIRYREDRQPLDTTPDYLLHGQHIYAFTDSTKLDQGFHFIREGDLYTVYKLDTAMVDLGYNTQLRELGAGFYALNIRNQVIGEDNRWWQLFILEQSAPDTLRIWYCTNGLTTDASMFYHAENIYYFNSTWDRSTLRNLLKKGYFEMCNVLRRAKN